MEQQEQQGKITQLVVFQLGSELYGADIGVVREVCPLQRVTRVPRTPRYIEGVTNLRGRVIPVADLRRRLGLPAAAPTSATRIAVAELDGDQVGMIVDAVLEVARVPDSAVEQPSGLVTGVDAEYVLGVTQLRGRLVILLDLAKVLNRAERKVI